MIGSYVLGLWIAAVAQDEPKPPPPPEASRIVVAEVTRIADPVAYLDTEAQAERMLFYWDKRRSLRIGDGVRNGVSGTSLLRFPSDGSELTCWGAAWFLIDSAGPQQRILEFKELTRAKVDVRGTETRLRFPGSVELVARDTVFYLWRDDFRTRFRIENTGPGDVSVSGSVVPTDVAAVKAGERLLLPIKTRDAISVGAETELISTETVRVWRGREVRFDAGVQYRTTPSHLILEGQGSARVGGARFRVVEGRRAQIWTPER